MWGNLGGNPVAAEGPKPLKAAGVVLHESVRHSIEGMMFMPVEPATMLVATLDVHEPNQGCFLLLVPSWFAEELAVSVHACTPEDVTEQMVTDVVAELINLIAGQFLSTFLPDDQLFQIGIPSVSRGASRKYDERAYSAFYSIGKGTLEFVITGQSMLDAFLARA
jgi:hypothetical protein